jgi:hypothetical protein
MNVMQHIIMQLSIVLLCGFAVRLTTALGTLFENVELTVLGRDGHESAFRPRFIMANFGNIPYGSRLQYVPHRYR